MVGDQVDQACHPLESEARELMINMNSTRSVRWTVKLGMARPITASLSSFVEGGGNITMLKVVVSRVYPLLYFVKSRRMAGPHLLVRSSGRSCRGRKGEIRPWSCTPAAATPPHTRSLTPHRL